MTPQRLKSGNQKDLKHSSGSDMVNTDKENMAPYQHLYDRIKQNPRNATKRSQPNALQRTSTSKHQAVLQQSKKSVPALQSDFSYIQDHPAMRGTSALPTPAPTSTDSDLTGEEEEATRLAKPTGSPRTSASLVFSENEAPETDRPTRANKREAVTDPGCDSQPLAKRSRSVSSQHERGLEGHGLTSLADPPYESIEALQTHFSHQPAGLGATQARQIEQVDRTSTSKRFGSDETPANTPVLSDYDKRAVQDIAFIERMRESLSAQSKGKTANVGKRQARRILDLLQRAKSSDDAEALILSADEAKAQLQANQYFSGPIITEGQQPLDLQTIQDFLSEQYNDDAKVCIQDPSVRVAAKMPHTREITIGMLKEIFQKDKVTGPCNCLELASHVEDGLRPAFLNTEDCRLLTKLKHPSSEDKASRRSYEPGWKEVEKWALLAKAGALTEPHQDSHGYSTYITVNQGTIGFGWLSNPTEEQRAAWRKDPLKFINGEWRYVVLRPGQTVYFPTGTVHFVFRHPGEGDTLAFGGHVLRCSQIVRWVRTLLEERETRSQITNEDLSVSAPEYLKRVEKFVLQARKTGQVEKWGGEEAIAEFLKLKAEFLAGEEGGK